MQTATSHATTYRDLCRQLHGIYDEGEARAVVRLLLEEGFGLSWADVLADGVAQLPTAECRRLEVLMDRLRTGEPVQHVLGFETFLGQRFKVSPAVLIPRPETEELCRWIDVPAADSPSILDIGTGSGCIAISLALAFPQASVVAWDISEEALGVARENAKSVHVDVSFHWQDALSPPDDKEKWNVIVSNPPYVCMKEKAAMADTVLAHEPSTALFVPDDDPLLFYRAIARYAIKALKPGGRLYFEINPCYADELCQLLKTIGFIGIFLKTDQFGKQRFVCANKDQRT